MRGSQQLTLAGMHIDILLAWLMGVIILVANGDSKSVSGCHWRIAAVNHDHRQAELALPFPVESPQGRERGGAVPVVLQVEVDGVERGQGERERRPVLRGVSVHDVEQGGGPVEPDHLRRRTVLPQHRSVGGLQLWPVVIGVEQRQVDRDAAGQCRGTPICRYDNHIIARHRLPIQRPSNCDHAGPADCKMSIVAGHHLKDAGSDCYVLGQRGEPMGARGERRSVVVHILHHNLTVDEAGEVRVLHLDGEVEPLLRWLLKIHLLLQPQSARLPQSVADHVEALLRVSRHHAEGQLAVRAGVRVHGAQLQDRSVFVGALGYPSATAVLSELGHVVVDVRHGYGGRSRADHTPAVPGLHYQPVGVGELSVETLGRHGHSAGAGVNREKDFVVCPVHILGNPVREDRVLTDGGVVEVDRRHFHDERPRRRVLRHATVAVIGRTREDGGIVIDVPHVNDDVREAGESFALFVRCHDNKTPDGTLLSVHGALGIHFPRDVVDHEMGLGPLAVNGIPYGALVCIFVWVRSRHLPRERQLLRKRRLVHPQIGAAGLTIKHSFRVDDAKFRVYAEQMVVTAAVTQKRVFVVGRHLENQSPYLGSFCD
ncbi:hypothetical protein EYF80_021781 [Liparis tanakae]|uniref:Uncharacterized protein n=1 Tax=Liparis tanakae TaxID=230148 RepID=A0A4Z2HQ76_9TELE|nr:hypothetical protein EYF80_021781 [Liparis tanakae]